MIGGVFVGIMALTAPFVTMQLRSSLPFMATPKHKVEKALQFLLSRRAAPKGKGHQHQRTEKPNFVDLGSGDGTAVLAAASRGWSATGLELNPTLWLLSSARRLLSRDAAARRNSRFALGDMFAVAGGRLRGADCVMVFGVGPLMPDVAGLVSRECRAGCFLMSYRFRVPLLADAGGGDGAETTSGGSSGPIEDSSSGCVDASLIYDEEEMRIYELKDAASK